MLTAEPPSAEVETHYAKAGRAFLNLDRSIEHLRGLCWALKQISGRPSDDELDILAVEAMADAAFEKTIEIATAWKASFEPGGANA